VKGNKDRRENPSHYIEKVEHPVLFIFVLGELDDVQIRQVENTYEVIQQEEMHMG